MAATWQALGSSMAPESLGLGVGSVVRTTPSLRPLKYTRAACLSQPSSWEQLLLGRHASLITIHGIWRENASLAPGAAVDPSVATDSDARHGNGLRREPEAIFSPEPQSPRAVSLVLCSCKGRVSKRVKPRPLQKAEVWNQERVLGKPWTCWLSPCQKVGLSFQLLGCVRQ